NIDVLGFRVYRDILWLCKVGIGSSAQHLMLGVWGWLDPFLSSVVLTRTPSQSWGRRKLGLLEFGFLCFLPNSLALLCIIDCLSLLARRVGAEQKDALVSHVFLASSCYVV
ncbi:hypothetical protein HAX54_023831, partial [Datura stramonium]|nr:hypothetical protein [Datura stramonium]